MRKECAEALKPCPFCGGSPVGYAIEPHIHKFATFMPDHPGSYVIECGACGIGIIQDAKQQAETIWNRRAAEGGEKNTAQQAPISDEQTESAVVGQTPAAAVPMPEEPLALLAFRNEPVGHAYRTVADYADALRTWATERVAGLEADLHESEMMGASAVASWKVRAKRAESERVAELEAHSTKTLDGWEITLQHNRELIERNASLESERDALRAEVEREHGEFVDECENVSGLSVDQLEWKESVLAIIKELKREANALREKLAGEEKDAERFRWYFEWTVKGENFVAAYMRGMNEHWTLDQWRSAIDAARQEVKE